MFTISIFYSNSTVPAATITHWIGRKSALLLAEYACSWVTVVVASVWLLCVIFKEEWCDREKNLFHSNQRFSLLGTIFFFLTYMQIHDEQICASMCIPMQYCFTVFMTHIIFELVQAEWSSDASVRSNHLIACLLGWAFPLIPITCVSLLNRDACWLHVGPELAFATMLPLIVVTSTACFLAETGKPLDVSTHGHSGMLTNAWLLYFSAIMVTQYQANLAYAICYACCCGSTTLCLRSRNRREALAINEKASGNVLDVTPV